MSEKAEQPPEPTPEDDAIIDPSRDAVGTGSTLAQSPPDVPADRTPEVPDIDRQRAHGAVLGYREGTDEWVDFAAGWWVAMRGVACPAHETKAFKDGHKAGREAESKPQNPSSKNNFVAEVFAGRAAKKKYSAAVMHLYRQMGGP